ncbi:MAG: capsular polysaccharide synthesis protein [Muribaculaceae bacterium]|nr:capsular polysaccharide synthesis protein [Muribaculaceae bacterium]
MKKFIEIFKRVDGKNVLKQYARTRVLFFALIQTVLLGFSRKSLEIVRLAVDNKIYSRLRKENLKFIELYKAEHKADDRERKYNPVIWTMWLQGMDKAPAIVQKCHESIRKNISDHEIIVITEKNFNQFVTLPDYILEKYKNGNISKTHFSDIVRIELLAVYGGTWLDSTVFCSGVPEHKYMLDSELFLFQTLKPGLNGHCRSVSTWMMTAYSNSKIILLVRALLHNYWKRHNFLIDYFIIHDFIQMAAEVYPEEWKRVVPFSNSTPHILLLRLFDRYDNNIWQALEKQTSFHKLSYKFDAKMYEQKGTYYDIILNHGNKV